MYQVLAILLALCTKVFSANINLDSNIGNFSYSQLGEHTIVTDSNVFPFVCAILKKSAYISAGVLIDESWVLTAGDSLFLLRESARELRVRLGSINYKKGGVLSPIKFYEIHPYFSDVKPEYDLALIKLAKPIRLTPSMNPIKLQKKHRDITVTHFMVITWPFPMAKDSEELQGLVSMEMVKRRRTLTVSHLHPSDTERCAEEKEGLDINETSTLLCLDPPSNSEPCTRDVGAPVVLNGILWGIISSWKPEDCELDPGPSFVSLVSANDISSWIHSTIRGHRWSKQDNTTRVMVQEEEDEEEEEDYENYNEL